jgi:hypothetical protein
MKYTAKTLLHRTDGEEGVLIVVFWVEATYSGR